MAQCGWNRSDRQSLRATKESLDSIALRRVDGRVYIWAVKVNILKSDY